MNFNLKRSLILRLVTGPACAMVALVLLTSSCSDRFQISSSNSYNPTRGWQGPFAADYGAFTGTTPLQSGGKTFSDFRLAQSASIGVLVGTFFDGTFFRTFGRTYSPYLLKGTGWASAGTSFTLLDAGGANYTSSTLGWIGSDRFLAASSTGALAVSGAIAAGTTWGSLTSAITAQPMAVTLPTNGNIAGIGYDQAGEAYLGSIGLGGAAYFHHYAPFTAWDAGAGIRLATGALQMDVASDGYDALATWTEVPQVAAGGSHTCAVYADGSVWCWGKNDLGQMGNGTTSATPQLSPVRASVPAQAIAISAGLNHTCALTSLGDIYCWGDNTYGQLGDNQISGLNCSSGTVYCSPGPVLALTATTSSGLSVGDNHACALVLGGAVKCWGRDDVGQIGDNLASGLNCVGGASRCARSPVSVTLGVSARAVALGSNHSCVITTAGNMKCWGTNANGETGNGNTTTPQAQPVDAVLGLAVGVQILQAAGGGNHTCALTSANTVLCWGMNNLGQTGSGDVATPKLVPVTVNLGGALSAQVTAGLSHSCALTTAGVIRCWGLNTSGETGNGNTVSPQNTAPFAQTVFPMGTLLGSVSSRRSHTCAVTTAPLTSVPNLYCWGANTNGEIGLGVTTPASVSTPDLPLGVILGVGLRAASPFSSTRNYTQALSTGDIKSFATATDGVGTTVAVFVQKNPTNPTCITNPSITKKCEYRVFASVKGLSGQWVGPTQLDSGFALDTTSLYQESGGIEYFTPGIAYIGNGIFLATFAVTNNINSPATAGIYSRKYTVGVGWDTSVTTIEEVTLTGTTEQIRMANDFKLASDGMGQAVLVSHYVVPTPDLTNRNTRSYGFQIYRYSSSTGWSTPYLISGNETCNVTTLSYSICANLRPQVMMLPGGEFVMVYPVPDNATIPTFLKLNTRSYVPF